MMAEFRALGIVNIERGENELHLSWKTKQSISWFLGDEFKKKRNNCENEPILSLRNP